MKLLLSTQGKLKPKHLSLFIMRGGGGGERMKGDRMVFRGTEGGETVIANRVQRGGAIRH